MVNREWVWRNTYLLYRQILSQAFFHLVLEEQEMVWARTKVPENALKASDDAREAWQFSLLILKVVVLKLRISAQSWEKNALSSFSQQCECELRLRNSNKARNNAIYMSSSAPCWLQVSLPPLLTRWCITSWFVDEWQAMKASLSRCSPTSNLLLIMWLQECTYTAWSTSSPSNVLKKKLEQVMQQHAADRYSSSKCRRECQQDEVEQVVSIWLDDCVALPMMLHLPY